MEFKVRWLGYTEDDDTWELYSQLRDTEQLLTYLRANRLVKLINKKHKKILIHVFRRFSLPFLGLEFLILEFFGIVFSQ